MALNGFSRDDVPYLLPRSASFSTSPIP